MKKFYKTLIVALLAAAGISELHAQDPEFTQFYANPLYLNPALAGNKICPRVNVNYRMQWPGVYGTYSTVGASLDRYSSKVHGGLGLMILQDRAAKGTLNTTGIGVIYAPYIRPNRNTTISFAIQAGYWQKAVNWNMLTFGDMIDPHRGFTLPTNETPYVEKHGNFDIHAGTVFSTPYFFIGAAVHHILQPNESLLGETSILPRKYTVHAGGNIYLNHSSRGEDDAVISPNILYQQQGDFKQLNLGLYAKKGAVVGGLWYRGNDSFIILLGVEAGSMKLGYSYDVTISKLTNSTAGAHEISLSYVFKCKPPKKIYRPAMCPSF